MIRNVAVLLISSTAALLSCEEVDPDLIDQQKPYITIISPIPYETYRGMVSIKAEAFDSIGIAGMEVFFKGNSIAKSTSSSIETVWDSRSEIDAHHEIKVRATDLAGNITDEIVTIHLRNVLYNLEFYSLRSFRSEHSEGWYFINDDQGTLVDVQRVEPGKTYRILNSDEFNGERNYSITVVDYQTDNVTGSSTVIKTYTDVPPSRVTFGEFSAVVDQPHSGTHHLIVQQGGEPTFEEKTVVSVDAIQSAKFSPEGGDYTIEASFFKSPAKIIYMIYNANAIPLKYEVLNAIAGETATVSQAEFIPFDSFVMPLIDATSSMYNISFLRLKHGLSETELILDYQNEIPFYKLTQDTNPDQLMVIDPHLEPAEYHSFFSYDKSAESNYYKRFSSQIPREFQHVDGTITTLEDMATSIKASAVGEFDLFEFAGFNHDFASGGPKLAWYIYGGGGNDIDIQKPKIPIEILNAYPELQMTIDFSVVSILDFDKYNSYQQWLNFAFNGFSIYRLVKDERIKTKYFAGTNSHIKAALLEQRMN